MRTTRFIAALVLLTACPADNPNDVQEDAAATETGDIPGGDAPDDDDDDDDDDATPTGDDDDDDDDGCIWNLKCDPANPGANINCEYTGGNNCDNMPPNQDADCIEFCLPFVPPGCDCFGCCEVDDGMGGKVNIFLNSHPDCAIDNLDACEQCTQSEDCVNTCDEENCELCFGETELPPECDDNMCDFGDTCKANADCPTDWYCLSQCCCPPPPG